MFKNAFLRNCFVFFVPLVFATAARAQVNWTGAVSTDWNTGANWSSGQVPGPADNVQIGLTAFAAQPLVSAHTQVHNLTFGGPLPVVLTVQAGSLLQVTNKIVQNHAAGQLTAGTLVTGAGMLSCASLMVGDLASPRFVQTKATAFVAKIDTFKVSGNIDLNSVTANLLTGGVANNNSLFSLQGGVVSLGGKINTGNLLPPNCNSFGGSLPNARFSIDINSDQDALLKLSDSSAVQITNTTYATVDFYNHTSGSGRSTVEYAGAGQLLYTSTTAGIDTSPYSYQDLVISGTGIKTAGSDSTGNQLNIAGNLVVKTATLDLKTRSPETLVKGDFTNRGTVNFGSAKTTIDGAVIFGLGTFNTGTGIIRFTGATQ